MTEQPSVKEVFTSNGDVKFAHVRNSGHPWDNSPGFDILHVSAKTKEKLEEFNSLAKKKFWAIWISGNCVLQDRETIDPEWPYGSALFKPSGANAPWPDLNGNMCP